MMGSSNTSANTVNTRINSNSRKSNESLDVIKVLRQTLDYHKGDHNTFFVLGASVSVLILFFQNSFK